MATFRQARMAGGHMILMRAAVADGQLATVSTWEDVVSDGEIVGSVLTERTCWLNGGLVRDPEDARQLVAEAMRA